MPKILFVCTGNTCRSPMAELIFNNFIKDNKDLASWGAISAGISAIPGQSATRYAVQVLDEEGISASGHYSKQLSENAIREADLVLTMTQQHKDIINNTNPEYIDKIFTLKEFTINERSSNIVDIKNTLYYDKLDIMDPYGQSEEVYRQTKEEIKNELKKILGKLNQFKFQAGEFHEMENIKSRGDIVKIALGSDHAGYELKKEILKYLEEESYKYIDMGTDSGESVDYPDFGYKVAQAVADGEFDKGILICGTGIGMSISANKVEGIRAALCHDVFSARATRNHNDSNVLTIGSRVVGIGLALEIVRVWLGESFDGGRHQNRIDKISKIERGEC